MIGIGIATATAGIIVGSVTLTGIGLVMTEFVNSFRRKPDFDPDFHCIHLPFAGNGTADHSQLHRGIDPDGPSDCHLGCTKRVDRPPDCGAYVRVLFRDSRR